jgi:predicted amidophosphoribosyltransferase
MTSVGVAWTGRVPESWRHGWPDVAVDKPSNVLGFIDGGDGLGLLGEVLAENKQPAVHFGSIARLGDGVYGLGRYFTTGDRRYPGHPLSHLVLRSKDQPSASSELALVFASLARAAVRNRPNLIVSVPPAPGDERDRFEAARAAVAEAFEARDGGGVLRQLYAVDDYRSTARDARAGRVADRFETTTPLHGERVLLLDDVLTSGAQSNACRVALKRAGSGGVSVVVASVTQDNNLWDPCPDCGEEYGGRKRTRTNAATGVEFHGCSRYPNCRWTGSL